MVEALCIMKTSSPLSASLAGRIIMTVAARRGVTGWAASSVRKASILGRISSLTGTSRMPPCERSSLRCKIRLSALMASS